MKKLLTICSILLLFLTACEGPAGPPGFDGLDGQDGQDAPLPSVFEESATFNYDAPNNVWISQVFSFNGTIDGDVFLTYLEISPGIFTLMPVSIFDEFGEYQYVFDHDINTVQLQIIGDSDLSTLDDESTTNVPIRIAIIPADLVRGASFENYEDFDTLLFNLDLDEGDIQFLN
ncbi:hypothetical protein EAX61_14430 [Dokdonia sinensis]|uniref:Collagen-like protein n=1 Tax=Dokdonia sinensis TaxID=2479847 RepID=A0A3M0FUG8_9FLAO|nr:hypothetical protein [Dokdonia sinensis]RMB56430.1 hypothetical protein EAX61_14430 [Dokdonia sinensis]